MLNLDDAIQVRLSAIQDWWKVDPAKYGGERPWLIPLAGSSRMGVGICLNHPLASYAKAFDLMAYFEPHPTVIPQIIKVYGNPFLPKKPFQNEAEVDAWFKKNERKILTFAHDQLYSDELIELTAEVTPHLDQIIPKCERCNTIWSVWMTDNNLWKKVAGTKWGKKRLCWRCFLNLCKKKKIKRAEMTLGYDWSLDLGE